MGKLKTALLVIDMQNGFLNPASPLYIAGAQSTVPACRKVIDRCRAAGVPVFFVTRSYDENTVEKARRRVWLEGGKPLSEGCLPELSAEMPFQLQAQDYYLVKPRYSAFFATGLDLILRRMGVTEIALAGTTTPNCIRSTAFDGLSLDYDVTVLSDCTSSATPEIQENNLRDMERVGARIIGSEAFARALSASGE